MDFGLLASLRQHLLGLRALDGVKIYTVKPPERVYPSVVLKLDEFWSSFEGHAVLERRRALIGVELWAHGATSSTYTRLLSECMKATDGVQLALGQSKKATFKFLKGQVGEADRQGVRVFRQNYEALIF